MKLFSQEKNKRTLLLGMVGVLLLFVASFGLWVRSTNAILGFGGKSVYVYYCPCSANLAVFVVGVKGGVYTFQPGVSQLFAWYQIWRAGPWVLGTYAPPGVCLWYIPYGCAGFPTMGTMIEVGTSTI